MTPILYLGIGWIVGVCCALALGAILSAHYADDLMAGMNDCSRTQQAKRNCG